MDTAHHRSIEAVVFDFDGTLVDSDPIKRSAFYDAAADFPGAASALDTMFGGPDAGDRYQVFAALAAHLQAEPAQAEIWAAEYGALCERRILELLGDPGIAQFLRQLKSQGYVLFIASATPRSDLAALIAKSPLASIFASIFGRPTSKIDSLREIMARHGWSPDQIIVVGNGESDRHAAETTACRFIGVGPDASAFARPVGVLAGSLKEIDAAIERLSLV